jgi:hypothetical protein
MSLPRPARTRASSPQAFDNVVARLVRLRNVARQAAHDPSVQKVCEARAQRLVAASKALGAHRSVESNCCESVETLHLLHTLASLPSTARRPRGDFAQQQVASAHPRRRARPSFGRRYVNKCFLKETRHMCGLARGRITRAVYFTYHRSWTPPSRSYRPKYVCNHEKTVGKCPRARLKGGLMLPNAQFWRSWSLAVVLAEEKHIAIISASHMLKYISPSCRKCTAACDCFKENRG